MIKQNIWSDYLDKYDMKDELVVQRVSNLLLEKPYMISWFQTLLSNNQILNPEGKLQDQDKSDVLIEKIKALNPDWL